VSGSVLLKNRRVLHRVFVRSRRSIDVTRVGVPRRWCIGMIVGDLAVSNHHVMRKHAPHRLGKATADGVLGYLERLPRLGVPGSLLLQRLLDEMQRPTRGVRLKISARPITLDGIAPLWDLPFKRHFGLGRRLG